MATYSRHSAQYAAPPKTLPITMPSKAPAFNYPVSRVAMSPPELSDSSTNYSGSRHSGGSYSARSSSYAPSQSSRDYDDYNATSGVDVVDMLSERMNGAFDTMKMDRSLARQAQT
jgi:biogenesis of lysosome-related organelles complex 1 subunit KXD1